MNSSLHSHRTSYAASILERCRGNEPAHCQAACPLHIDNRRMLALIGEGEFDKALAVVREKLPFPKLLGRICTRPCELACKRRDVDEPVAICDLKRFVADRQQTAVVSHTPGEKHREQVAIVGAGPAGAMAAMTLRRMGYPVTLFEAEGTLGGAVHLYIPRYRLPHQVIEEEFNPIFELGVQVRFHTRLDRDLSLAELRIRFQAVFLALGAHAPVAMNIPGEQLPGVHSALSLLRQVNSDQPMALGSRVAVIGGGDAAIDAARTARRLGAIQVTVFYRRSAEEIGASPKERLAAEQEGIHFHYLTAPKAIHGQDMVQTLECLRMSLGPPDASGRPRPLPITGSEFRVPVDTVVVAIGQTVAGEDGLEGLQMTPWGTIQVDPVTLQTNLSGVFAAGDAVRGPDTVVNALAAGRHAATSIGHWLRGQTLQEIPEELASWDSRLGMNARHVPKAPRQQMPELSMERRIDSFEATDLGFSEEAARKEAARCLSCACQECVKSCSYLEHHCESPLDLVTTLDQPSHESHLIPYGCNLCGLCAEICPEKLDTGVMMLEAREQLVAAGSAPLPIHQSVLRHQRWSTSKVFTSSQAPGKYMAYEYVFFPGCGLPGYSPKLVSQAYHYLRQHVPNTGIVLDCCGTPTRNLGDLIGFERIRRQMVSAVQRLGTNELILACPNCQHTIKTYVPELEVTTLYQFMDRFGPPIAQTIHPNSIFSIHDSCVARHETNLQDNVRALIQGIGYRIEEMTWTKGQTRCCGSGGMARRAEPERLTQASYDRAHETPHDIVTYCAGCRATLASTRKPTLHILDLFFNPSWSVDKSRLLKEGMATWTNRGITKARLWRGK